MKKQLIVALSFLTLGAAHATGTDTSTSVTVNASTKVLVNLIANGTQVTLLDKDGNLVATVNADGTLTLAQGAQLSAAVTIRVGEQDYTLASALTKAGQFKVETVNVQDKTQRLPLIAVLNRQAQAAHAANAERKDKGAEQPTQQPEQEKQPEQAKQPEQGKPEKTEKPAKPTLPEQAGAAEDRSGGKGKGK